jgi:hypothetical protein
LETECDAKCKQYTINAQYTKSIDHPKWKLEGKNCMKAEGDCPKWVDSDQRVLRTVRQGGWTA